MENTLVLKKQKIKIKEKDENINKIYLYFSVFMLGCIVGFVYESLLGIYHFGGLYSKQGLLVGPFVPVYGIGAILFTFFLKNMSKKFDTFIAAMLIGGIFEYLYSLIQELIFGTVSWDYPTEFLNIGGRTSVIFALFWGVIGFAYIRYIYPVIVEVLSKVNTRIFSYICNVLIIFMSMNICLTILTSFRQTERYRGIAASNQMERFLDEHFSDEKLNQLYTNRIRKK
ncbi:MAG: putative ABC transporter permease [Clostridia bacterium]|nr:putative ABC transporter permease [Clostridia bacterium]